MITEEDRRILERNLAKLHGPFVDLDEMPAGMPALTRAELVAHQRAPNEVHFTVSPAVLAAARAGRI